MPSGVYERKPLTKGHKKNISKGMKGKHVGKNNPMYGKFPWNKGSTKETDKRIAIKKGKNLKGDNITNSSWYYRARKLYEERHGVILKGFILHHRNEDITDNRDENHKLYPSQSEHTRYHKALERGLLNV